MRGQLRVASRGLRLSSVREFSWLSGANQLTGFLSILALLVLTRLEPVGVVGQVVFAQAAAGIVMLFLDVRFEDAIQRFFPLVLRESSSPKSARAFFWRAVRWDVRFGLTVAAVTTIAWLIELIPETPTVVPHYIAIAMIASGLGTSVGSLNAGFAVTQSLTRLAKITAATSATTSVFAILGTLLLGGTGFLVGALLGTLVHVAVLFGGLRDRLPPCRATDQEWPRGMGRFLAMSSAASSAGVGTEGGVLTVVGLTGGGPTMVAFLKVAQAPMRLVMAVFSPIAVQAFPRLAALAAHQSRDSIVRLTRQATIVVLAIGGIVCLVAMPSMAFVIGLTFGANYVPAALAANLMLAAGVLRSSTTWAKVLPLAVGRPGLRLAIVLMQSILILVGSAIISVTISNQVDATNYVAALEFLISGFLLLLWTGIARWRGLLRREHG